MDLLDPEDNLPVKQHDLLLLGVPDCPDGKGEVPGCVHAHQPQEQEHQWTTYDKVNFGMFFLF